MVKKLLLLLLVVFLASFTYADLNTKLLHVYNFETNPSTSDLEDQVGTADSLSDSVSKRVSGINNYGWNFEFDTADNVVMPAKIINKTNNLTILIWSKFNLTGQTREMLWSSNGIDESYMYITSTPNFRFKLSTATTQDYTFGNPVANKWYMLAMVFNSTHLTYYVNSTKILSETLTGTTLVYNDLRLGEQFDSTPNTNLDGVVDEFYIWNRSLSQTEINTLYNGGTGLFYPFATLNWIHPTPDDGVINNSQVILNATCDFGDVTIWLDSNSNPTTKVVDNQPSPASYTTAVTSNQKYYYKGSCLGGITNSSVRQWTFDNRSINFSINSNNFFTTNKTHLTSNTILVNFTFEDNLDLDFVKVNFSQSNNTRQFDYLDSLGSTLYYNKTLNISNWNSGLVNLSIEYTDGANWKQHYYIFYIDTFNLTVVPRNIITGSALTNVTIKLNDSYRPLNFTSNSTFNNLREGLYYLSAFKNGYNNYFENFTLSNTGTKYIDLGFNASFNLFDEKTGSAFNISSPSSVQFLLFCPSSTEYYDVTNTSFNIPITCDYTKFKFTLNFDTSSYYRTLILAPDSVNNVSVYLIDLATSTAIYNTFKLDDLLDVYEGESIYLNKYVGGDYVLITADYVDAENKIGAYLLENTEYQITIKSSNLPDRNLGSYSADVAGEKVLRLYDVSIYPQTTVENRNFYMWTTNESNSTIAHFYFDFNNNPTSSVTFKLFEDNYNGTLITSTTISNPETSTWEYNITNYNIVIGGIEYSNTVSGKVLKVGSSKIELGIQNYYSPAFFNMVITILLGSLALFATIRTGNAMSMFLCAFAALLIFFGWYGLSWSILAMGTLVSLISLLKEGSKDEGSV